MVEKVVTCVDTHSTEHTTSEFTQASGMVEKVETCVDTHSTEYSTSEFT